MGCDYITSCFVFKKSLVFHFSIDSLQNLTILLFTPTNAIDFPPSYVECYQILSGNQSRLYLNSCFFSCSPHILPLISLIDPCNLYFQGDILFALLVVSSAIIIIVVVVVVGYILGTHTALNFDYYRHKFAYALHAN
jgi:hypothetical protein